MKATRYVIISPVRNEARYLPATILSVAGQTVLPERWVIVDDGSSDQTARIAQEAAKDYPWITCVSRVDRGERKAGIGVMEAFYSGFYRLDCNPWQFLVKLDGDVSFGPDYFERCFAKFAEEAQLGIGGGLVCRVENGDITEESTVDPAFHVRGPTKIYRRECWDAIGGLVKATGWDTIDELKANMLGWKTRTFPDISLIHHRPTGAAYGSWSNSVKNGRANYAAGYHPLFMALKCASRVVEKPYGMAALGLWVGYCTAFLRREWRVEDRAFHRYFTNQQMRRLTGQPNLWNQ